MALAFYREGLDLEHVHRAYSFLSFFKILNVRFNEGRDQIAWINATYGSLTRPDSIDRLGEIAAIPADIGEYLYGSGRCAVAHAFATPVVDPDNIEDQIRLSKDWRLVRGLAALVIQREWAIPAPSWQAAV